MNLENFAKMRGLEAVDSSENADFLDGLLEGESGKKIKAAGGISSMDDAEKFLELGADRLGTSRIIKLIKKEEATGY